jgi:membrane protease YdiL (CAAX protease family)
MGALWSERFEAFVAPARRSAALWRLAAGCGLAAACWIAATALLVPAILDAAGGDGGRTLPVVFLLSFPALMLGLALAAHRLHHRSFASLVGPDGLLWRQFWAGVGVVCAGAVVVGVPVLLAAPPELQGPAAAWLLWLPLALALVLLQTAAEELAFRGYLMQQLAARFRSPAVWLGVPAVLFGLLHWNPAEFGPNAWLVVLSATAIGLVLGDVTARTGNLSAAMGLHFANNALALLVVAVPSPLSSLSLFLASVGPGDVAALRRLLLLDLGTTLAAYALWLAWWHRRA